MVFTVLVELLKQAVFQYNTVFPFSWLECRLNPGLMEHTKIAFNGSSRKCISLSFTDNSSRAGKLLALIAIFEIWMYFNINVEALLYNTLSVRVQ